MGRKTGEEAILGSGVGLGCQDTGDWAGSPPTDFSVDYYILVSPVFLLSSRPKEGKTHLGGRGLTLGSPDWDGH